MARISYAQAFVDGLYSMMSEDPYMNIIGHEIVGTGSEGHREEKLLNDFGDRFFDLPTSEQAIGSLGIGAAMAGQRMVVHFGNASFALEAWNQFMNEAAPAHYMSNGKIKVPVTFHMSHGIRGGGAAQHSITPQAMFSNCPGLEVVMPSSAHDVKGLIRTAVKSDSPTIVFAHPKLLPIQDEVPDAPYDIPFGKADIKRLGKDVTVVAFSYMVQVALNAAETLAKEGIDVEVVDPRTISPIDREGIAASVRKTGRLVTVDESILTCGVGAEVAASVSERAWDSLKGPIVRVARAHAPIPFSPPLEEYVMPTAERIIEGVRRAFS